MINNTLVFIKSDKMLYDFLKYHSYYYKKIYRGEDILNDFIKEFKEENKLTYKDKIEDINNKINMIRNVLEIFS